MEQKQHYYWLDLIRFLAAFAVVACHGRGCFLPEYAALPSDQKNLVTVLFYGLTRLGNEAVICFFILSGFLVGGRGISKMLKGKFDWKSYAIDRFSRIFPPLFGAVLFYMAIFFWRQEEINYLHCLGNLLSLQGIVVLPVSAPFWSLSYEVWFYILLGSVGGFALQKSLSFRYCCFGLLLLCAWIFYRLQAVFLFVWLLGAVTYFLIPHRTCRPVLIAGGAAADSGDRFQPDCQQQQCSRQPDGYYSAGCQSGFCSSIFRCHHATGNRHTAEFGLERIESLGQSARLFLIFALPNAFHHVSGAFLFGGGAKAETYRRILLSLRMLSDDRIACRPPDLHRF